MKVDIFKKILDLIINNFNIDTPICENKYKFNNQLKNIKRKILIKLDKYKKKKTFLLEKKDYLKKTRFIDYNKIIFLILLYIEGHYESEKYFYDLKKYINREIYS